MPEQVKDFRYYADKAEHEIQLSLGRDDNGQVLVMSDGAKHRHIARAEIYAKLAASAPPKGPCTASLTAVGPTAAHDRERPCVYPAGHADDHLTSDGVRFHR